MQLVEFYINDRLLDISNAKDLGIKLNRQIFKPAEFTSKDSQMSYKITIPNTPTNNDIFNYTNVEEVKDKFNFEYNAKVYVDNILIFDGLFMLQEITETKYIGNLYIPAYKSVKDIFGERTMNNPSSNSESNKWIFNITKSSDITNWNKQVLTDFNNNKSSNCLFPYVLYGLIPKVPVNPDLWVNGEQVGDYTGKDVYDEYARLGYPDIPPAVNVLEAIKHIFGSNNLNISGTAFEDDRLRHLYMSYSNPSEYEQEWNYGDLGDITVNGNWKTADKNGNNYTNFERAIYLNEDGYGKYFNIDLFNSNKSNLSYTDTGTNINYNVYPDGNNYTRKNLTITIPKDGWYKVSLDANITLNSSGEALKFHDNGNKFTGTTQSRANRNNRFDRSSYEVQLLRDWGEGDFNAGNIVGKYNEPNFPQNKDSIPRYYPKAGGAMVVDPQTNQNFICGLHWGRDDNSENPQDTGTKANYMFIKNGYSFNRTFTQKERIYNLYDSSNNSTYNYWCYGTNDDNEVETDEDDDTGNPIWYQAQVRYGKVNNLPTTNFINSSSDITGSGRVNTIIYLHRGEHLTLNVCGVMGDRRQGKHSSTFDQWVVLIDNLTFNLSIKPFRTDIGYGNYDINGNYDPARIISYNDPNNFQKGYIDLCKFLPSEVRINDFMDNICKAFNLKLSQPTKGNFLLDVKQTKSLGSSDIINFEDKFNIRLRTNEPLGLPSEIIIKFTIDAEEEGFVESGEYTGSGNFITGTIGGSVSEQSSTFSYCWYKDINFKTNTNTTIVAPVPVISKHEVWEEPSAADYVEMQKKWYQNLHIRFFYPDDVLGNKNIFKLGTDYVDLLKVKNEYNKTTVSILDYENKEYSILNNYFTIITTNDTNYTIIQTYLTPEEYELLDGRNLIKLNSDLYYVSAVDGYDPLMKNMAKIKLIRKM